MDHWRNRRSIPSLAISFDVHTQSFDVSGTSDLGFADKQTENVLTSVFIVDGGISTPALSEGLGSPRIFVQAGIQAPLSDETMLLTWNTIQQPPGGESSTFCSKRRPVLSRDEAEPTLIRTP